MKKTLMRRLLSRINSCSWLVAMSVCIGGITNAADRLALNAARPNIILIMPDDMGWGDIAAHGNPLIQTPNLDRLYAESMRFTNFHVSPTCSPTRSALMSGRHEFKNGVTHTILERERMSLKTITLAQVLKSAGYTTGIFGKWHLGDEDAYQPNRRGFDEVYIHGAGGIGQSYPGSCGDAPGNKYFDPAIRHNGTFVKTQGYCTDLFFAQATKWIDANRGNPRRPFFAYITPNAPHGPLVSPGPQYDKLYEGKEIGGKKLAANDVPYYSMITNIDENIGKLLARVKEWRIAENTLVIFLSDNGGTHTRLYSGGYRGGKGTMYSGGTHAPSFWRWPGKLRAGSDSAALTAHLDVLPTLADLAGVTLSEELRQQVEGRSLVPLLTDPQADWPNRTLVTHVGRWEKGQAAQAKHAKSSIRDSRFRLVENKELFDLQADRGETTNVIDQHPDAVARLRAAYDQWWNDVQPLLVNEDAVGPKVNPFKEAYWKQFGGGPEDSADSNPAPKRAKKNNKSDSPPRPNVIVIVADDLGYADVGFHGCKDIPTPHLDTLAKSGVVCTSGYVSHPFCSPTRAGLMTGRYQQRFGHENNPRWEPANEAVGLPLAEVTIADAMKAAGYIAGAVGKWHLGAHPAFHPNRRGFEHYFGLLGGGHQYFDHNQFRTNPIKAMQEYFIPLVRNETPVEEHEYLTDALAREAAAFVEAHRAKPFFLYLAFNAPHTPLQAPDKYLARVKDIEDEKRRTYAAMVCSMDDAIGQLTKKLAEHQLDQNTLIFFFSDNGGPVSVTNCSNAPLRGAKGQVYEGGVRVPFVVAWPARLKPGKFDQPVSSLDVFATSFAATGKEATWKSPLDSVNLLPHLSGAASAAALADRPLFWRTGGGASFAVRQDNLKLVRMGKAPDELYDLSADIGEEQNTASSRPEVAAALAKKLDAWNAELVEPKWSNPQAPRKKP